MSHRRSNLVVILLTVVGLGLFAAFVAWAFHASGDVGGGWEGLAPILPMVIIGLIVVGGLTGVLMWLAFYSSRHGYDEPFDWDEEPPSR